MLGDVINMFYKRIYVVSEVKQRKIYSSYFKSFCYLYRLQRWLTGDNIKYKVMLVTDWFNEWYKTDEFKEFVRNNPPPQSWYDGDEVETLSHEKLIKYAKENPIPQSWYDEEPQTAPVGFDFDWEPQRPVDSLGQEYGRQPSGI